MTGPATAPSRSVCLVPIWLDGIYRVRCSMGTKGVCAKHGAHKPHPTEGRCDPMEDGFCRTHLVYVEPTSNAHPRGAWICDGSARCPSTEHTRSCLSAAECACGSGLHPSACPCKPATSPEVAG